MKKRTITSSERMKLLKGYPWRLYDKQDVLLMLNIGQSKWAHDVRPLFPPSIVSRSTRGKRSVKPLWTDNDVLRMLDHLYHVSPRAMSEIKERISLFSKPKEPIE